jgi:hypothetical protein
MSAWNQRLCAACGPLFVLLWLVAFWPVAGFVPPPSPRMPADQVAQFFADDRTAIRVGLLIAAFASALIVPWTAAISTQLRRIEGVHSVLSTTQMASGTLLTLEFIFPTMWWQVAAFRPERDLVSIGLLNDLAWICFIGIVSTTVVQVLVIGVVMLQDQRHAAPVFPRWMGYFTIWAAIVFSPGALCVFFQSGPFAWNGLFAWWLPLGVFAVWIGVMYVMLLRAIKAGAGDPAPVDVHAELASLRTELSVLTQASRSAS